MSRAEPRVLIIDDNAEFRRVARKLLELRGYRVACEASCAASALTAVARLAPAAVLLDVRLGDDCGFALARALARRKPAPAVLLTSSTDDGDGEMRARASGARGFVLKSGLAAADLSRFWPAGAVRQPRRR